MKHDITLPLAKAFIGRTAAHGYEVRMSDVSQGPRLCLDAYFGKKQVCQFEISGAMRHYRDNLLIAQRKELHNLLLTMKQAHDLYADAPPFAAAESKGFRLISAFGDAVLAARMGGDDEMSYDEERKLHKVMEKVESNNPSLMFDHEVEPEHGMEV